MFKAVSQRRKRFNAERAVTAAGINAAGVGMPGWGGHPSFRMWNLRLRRITRYQISSLHECHPDISRLCQRSRFCLQGSHPEGKITIGVLVVVSVFSWTVIITKGRQLLRARKVAQEVFRGLSQTKDPLEIARSGEQFDGAPAYELYATGTEELNYHLKHNPIEVRGQKRISDGRLTP